MTEFENSILEDAKRWAVDNFDQYQQWADQISDRIIIDAYWKAILPEPDYADALVLIN